MSLDSSTWNGEQWADLAHVFVVEPSGLADGLDVRSERRKRTEKWSGS